MIEFIVKYWVQWLLTIISGFLIFLVKKFYTLYKNVDEAQRKKEHKEISDKIEQEVKSFNQLSIEQDIKLQNQIDLIINGILSIQGKMFKQECHELLQEGHDITIDEFENIQADHKIYNQLGGNHEGDTLFKMVEKKATNNITNA